MARSLRRRVRADGCVFACPSAAAAAAPALALRARAPRVRQRPEPALLSGREPARALAAGLVDVGVGAVGVVGAVVGVARRGAPRVSLSLLLALPLLGSLGGEVHPAGLRLAHLREERLHVHGVLARVRRRRFLGASGAVRSGRCVGASGDTRHLDVCFMLEVY